MLTASAELTVLQSVAQFVSYAVLAIFTENVVFSRAMGVSRLIKLVSDPEVRTWQYCTPVILVQLLSAPLGWACMTYVTPLVRDNLPEWLPIAALRPIMYLTCAVAAMAVVWLLLAFLPAAHRAACREQLPLATCTCSVLGTLLLCANQNYDLLQCTAFGFGSGVTCLQPAANAAATATVNNTIRCLIIAKGSFTLFPRDPHREFRERQVPDRPA